MTDGLIRSKDQGTGTTNRRVLADGAVHPEHLSEALLRSLGDRFALQPGDVHVYHLNRDEFPPEPRVGEWAEESPLPGGARWRMFGTRFVDELHLAGGTDDSSAAVTTHEVYDLRRGAWLDDAASMPSARQAGTSGVHGGLWYLAGGTGDVPSAPSSSLYVYDFADDSWSTGASMPAARDQTAGAMLDGRLHVVGGRSPGQGWDPAAGSTSHYVYDPDSDSWDTAEPLPSARRRAGGFAYGGFLYVLCGSSGTTRLDDLLRYDPAADSWETLAAAPEAVSSPDFGVVDGRLWLHGGIDADGDPLGFAYVYHFLDGVWRQAPARDAKPTSAGAFYDANNVVYGGRIHSVGGRDAEFGSGVDAHEVLVAADHDHERGHDARVTRRGDGAEGQAGIPGDGVARIVFGPDPPSDPEAGTIYYDSTGQGINSDGSRS